MRMLDLFSGIGGFALAGQWRWGKELDIVGFCEIEEYAQKVLKKNFPDVPIYQDITKLDGTQFKDIDLITGGFPCQDISVAGKGKGLIDEETGKRTRSGLWSEMHRIISEIRPRFAIIENVPMLTIRGGTRVIADLAQIGYDAEWQIIGADDVGAWHRRKRIWIVAYFRCQHEQREIFLRGIEKQNQKGDAIKSERSTECDRKRIAKRTKDVSNSNISRLMERQCTKHSTEKRINAFGKSKSSGTHERDVSEKNIFNTSRHRRIQEQFYSKAERKEKGSLSREYNRTNSTRRNTKKPKGYWKFEPELGRVANGIPNRVDRLKGLGNAIVPQVAYEIMKRIK